MTTETRDRIIERDHLAATNLTAFMRAASEGRVPIREPIFGNVRNAIIGRALRRHRLSEQEARQHFNNGLRAGLAGVRV